MKELKKGQRITTEKDFSLVVLRINSIVFENKKQEDNIGTRICFTVVYRETGKDKDYEISLIIEKTKKGTLKVDVDRPCLVPNYMQYNTVRAVYNQYCHQVNDELKKEEQKRTGVQMSLF